MDASSLALSGPDAAIAALPYLLGFPPRESAVVLWLADGRLALTQRLDLPRGDEHGPWLDAIWCHRAPQDAALVVLVTEHPVADGLVDGLLGRAADQGTEVRDVLATDGVMWRSLLCRGESCCPVEGRRVDPSVAVRIAAEFAAMGRAPVANRDELVREFAADPGRQAEVASQVSAPPPDRTRRERWRDVAIRTVLAQLGQRSGTEAPAAEGIATLVVALSDIRVRDTVLWELARRGDLATELGHLAAAVRSAPAGQVAPVATCAAIVAWCQGDGARALSALDRALHDDADYSLALLVRQALAAGLPPAEWRASLSQITREECRRAA